MDIIKQTTSQIPLAIIGDFNLDVTHDSNKSFCEVMKTKYNCDQHVTQPTADEQTTIDLIFSNYPHQRTGATDCYWSDHKLLYTVIEPSKAAHNTVQTNYYIPLIVFSSATVSNNYY